MEDISKRNKIKQNQMLMKAWNWMRTEKNCMVKKQFKKMEKKNNIKTKIDGQENQ